MDDDLVRRSIDLGRGELLLLQPRESAELPDAGAVEWAPVAPYWEVLWRSGVALAQEVDSSPIADRRVVELGCGLALPALAAARAGGAVLATDAAPEALELARRNAALNGIEMDAATADWNEPAALVAGGPFDLVLAADLLYERASVRPLLSLVERLAAEVWLADPGRESASEFIERAGRRWEIETVRRGAVRIHRMRLRPGRA